MPRISLTDQQMNELERKGIAEILYRPAAEEEFNVRFGHTRPNQLVAKVTKYYRHSNYGYEEVPLEDIQETT